MTSIAVLGRAEILVVFEGESAKETWQRARSHVRLLAREEGSVHQARIWGRTAARTSRQRWFFQVGDFRATPLRAGDRTSMNGPHHQMLDEFPEFDSIRAGSVSP